PRLRAHARRGGLSVSDALLLEAANGEFIRRTSGAILPCNGAYTVMWWQRHDGTLEDSNSFCVGTGLSAYDHVYPFGSGDSVRWCLEAAGGSGGTSSQVGDF